jgi:glutathione-regulated potassium-efflux system ancillary protein KefF
LVFLIAIAFARVRAANGFRVTIHAAQHQQPTTKPSMILIVHAHPYPSRSRAGRALLAAATTLPEVSVRSLYVTYPDFDIDIAAEQAALASASHIVWLHPLYWYSVPGLMKHWFDKVLSLGWAYGKGGHALRGKHVLWAPTTGGDEAAYHASGMHEHPFPTFVPPVEETARFCGMVWAEPFVVHGAHTISADALAATAEAFKQRLVSWSQTEHIA